MKLYKYRDFSAPSEDHFEQLNALLHREAFWCAPPATLNDPKEFDWECDYAVSANTQSLLAELLVQINGRTRAQAQERAVAAISSGRLATFARPIVEDMIDKCRNEIGLVCFGSSSNNPILWQRYGGSGAGVCIEIEVPEDLLENQIYRVQYSASKSIHIDQLMHAFIDPQKVREVYALALLTKPASWAAEEEFRFVSRKQEVLVRIDRSKITRLIFGEALPATVRKRIEEIAAASSQLTSGC